MEAVEEARKLYNMAGSLAGEASAIIMAVVLHSQRSDGMGGLDLPAMIQEAKEFFAEAHDSAGEQAALQMLADINAQAGQYGPLMEFLQSKVDLGERSSNTKAQAEAMQSMANWYMMGKDFEKSETLILDAQDLAYEA